MTGDKLEKAASKVALWLKRRSWRLLLLPFQTALLIGASALLGLLFIVDVLRRWAFFSKRELLETIHGVKHIKQGE